MLITDVIEAAIGSTVLDEIERYFLEPMQLENTFISMGEPPPAKYPAAHPWVYIDRDGTLEDLYGIPPAWIATLTHPVMFSNPADLVRWLQAHVSPFITALIANLFWAPWHAFL